jgi:hypothetical protein
MKKFSTPLAISGVFLIVAGTILAFRGSWIQFGLPRYYWTWKYPPGVAAVEGPIPGSELLFTGLLVQLSGAALLTLSRARGVPSYLWKAALTEAVTSLFSFSAWYYASALTVVYRGNFLPVALVILSLVPAGACVRFAARSRGNLPL